MCERAHTTAFIVMLFHWSRLTDMSCWFGIRIYSFSLFLSPGLSFDFSYISFCCFFLLIFFLFYCSHRFVCANSHLLLCIFFFCWVISQGLISSSYCFFDIYIFFPLCVDLVVILLFWTFLIRKHLCIHQTLEIQCSTISTTFQHLQKHGTPKTRY